MKDLESVTRYFAGTRRFSSSNQLLHENHLGRCQVRCWFLAERDQEPSSVRRDVVTSSPSAPEIIAFE